jgi:hypothetical protein
MARSKRPNPDEPTQFCLAIDRRNFEVVKIFGTKNGYSLGGHTYANEHNNPLEGEIGLIHDYIDELRCMPMHMFNTPIMHDMEADLNKKAAKMKTDQA